MNAACQSCEQGLPQKTGRVPFWDVLKFFAILLVVYGHVSGAFGCKVLEPWASNFRIGMNMPLFFIISGYFAAKTIEKGDWRKLGRHLVGYFWPLATVSVVFAILSVVFNIEGSECGLVGYAGRRFLFAGWFLWCLAFCFAITFLCRRVASGWKFYLALCLVYGILLVDISVWHIGNTRAMLPFFVAGAALSGKKGIWEDWRVGAPCLLAYMAAVFLQGDIWKNGLGFYNSSISWTAVVNDPKAIGFAVARFVNGMIGSIGICWAVQYLLVKCKMLEALASLGTTTLGVYILHQWILARVFTGLEQVKVAVDWRGEIILAIVLFAFCHWIVWLSRKFSFTNRFVWGGFVQS